MFRPLIALTAAALVALPVATASAAGSGSNDQIRTYVSNCEKQVYKPKTITVFCADAGVVISKIRYQKYNSKVATGTGTATVNLCEPNCAAGNTENFKVRFRLYRVTQCGDAYQYRRLRVRYVGPKPPGRRVINQSFPCADAPTR
jgi:hypothetical protein